jgi:hypothetical protein
VECAPGLVLWGGVFGGCVFPPVSGARALGPSEREPGVTAGCDKVGQHTRTPAHVAEVSGVIIWLPRDVRARRCGRWGLEGVILIVLTSLMRTPHSQQHGYVGWASTSVGRAFWVFEKKKCF